MNWLPIALAAPFCWAIVNHIDKYLLEKHFKDHGVGALILYSCLFGVYILPLAALLGQNPFLIPPSAAMLLIGIGVLTGLSIAAYLNALRDEEASMVSPIFQTIPVFGLIFGFFFLQEIPTQNQTIAGLIILLGSLVVSLEIHEETCLRIKWKPLLLMLVSAALYGFHEVLFKMGALETSFWVSIFWSTIGLFLFGSLIYIIMPESRRGFLKTFQSSRGTIIGISILSEALTTAGNFAILYATLLAPIAVVQLVAGYQPIMVFLIGMMLTALYPHIATEKFRLKHIIHKVAAISLVLIGTVLLYT